MKKSQLLKQNEQLFSKLQLANLSNKRLMSENLILKEKLDILTSKLNSLSSENFAKSADEIEPENYDTLGEEPSASFEQEPKIQEESVKQSVELSPELEYGSKIIGDIVMESVSYSNMISEQNKPNIKELINLILGKTEVAKSKILDISLSDTSLENKFSMMDSEFSETIEYFKSVLAQ